MDVMDRHGSLITRYVCEATSAEAKTALDLLAALPVRSDDWQPVEEYDRTALPLSWVTVARLGADMKDLMLARAVDLSSAVFDSDGFTLRYGEMVDPYTGESMVFEQTEDRTEFRVELDHVVSLADAFCSGGYRWSPTGYNWPRLANDPGNLQAVSKGVNQSKSNRNAAQWLPIDDFRRRFVILQIQVKTRYRLSVTEAEAATMYEVLAQ